MQQPRRPFEKVFVEGRKYGRATGIGYFDVRCSAVRDWWWTISAVALRE